MTENIGPQELYEKCGSTFSLLVALGGAALGLSGVPAGVRDPEQSNESGEVRRVRSVASTGDGTKGQRRLHWCSVAELGRRLGCWISW